MLETFENIIRYIAVGVQRIVWLEQFKWNKDIGSFDLCLILSYYGCSCCIYGKRWKFTFKRLIRILSVKKRMNFFFLFFFLALFNWYKLKKILTCKSIWLMNKIDKITFTFSLEIFGSISVFFLRFSNLGLNSNERSSEHCNFLDPQSKGPMKYHLSFCLFVFFSVCLFIHLVGVFIWNH